MILASGSDTRAALLRRAGIDCRVEIPRVDEDAIKDSLSAEGLSPRDIADALAEAKALKVSARYPGELVLGCDQVLDSDGQILSKPATREACAAQIHALSGKPHALLSAAVIARDGEPMWRHVGVVRLRMRQISPAYLDGYLDRNWPGLATSVGGYKLEEEGIRLFSSISGDYFHVLGLPLLELIGYLVDRGDLET